MTVQGPGGTVTASLWLAREASGRGRGSRPGRYNDSSFVVSKGDVGAWEGGGGEGEGGTLTASLWLLGVREAA